MKKINDLMKKSTKAVCGITERELSISKHKLSSTIKTLKKSGHYIVGTSYGKTPMKKVWFIKGGAL